MIFFTSIVHRTHAVQSSSNDSFSIVATNKSSTQLGLAVHFAPILKPPINLDRLPISHIPSAHADIQTFLLIMFLFSYQSFQ
mmetsp:Transcript_51589/g.62164  ORF Transcript_51589/g.62164 Transcript_51589/m.62164 type:complete len:82 (-) Transcript_51589:4-249(-)